MFALNIDDGWPPVGSEGVWCEVNNGKFTLKNAPFFISNLAVGDVFTADLDPVNKHVFEFSVIEQSGHSLIWIMNNKDIDLTGFKSSLHQLKCNTEELQRFSYHSVDVPVDVNVNALNKLIDNFEKKGLDFAFPVWRHG
jgi:hypothetical protein